MTYDEQLGLVERGTPGHRASAQVMDVDAEIRALHRIMSRPPYDMEGARNRLAWVWLYGESASDARRESWRGYVIAHSTDRTAMTMYRVDGNPIHMQAHVTLPTPAQMLNVNVTIGGDE